MAEENGIEDSLPINGKTEGIALENEESDEDEQGNLFHNLQIVQLFLFFFFRRSDQRR